jgi:8-oxo-dGTP pyrophosphatase MutT (NUDIX family)
MSATGPAPAPASAAVPVVGVADSEPPRPMRPLTSLKGFDPRQVPVSAVDSHLPALSAERLQAAFIRERFGQPRNWQPEMRRDQPVPGLARTPANAAVLIALLDRGDGLRVVLTERTHLLPTHAGQVAFPGGKVDQADADERAAALREAWEEIGLPEQSVEVVGQLPAYHTVTAFRVTPVVGMVHGPVTLNPNPGEVAAVFEVPLAFLMNPAHHRRHLVQLDGAERQWLSMPWNDHGTERFIWGATAAMLRNLYGFLSAE